MSDRSTRGSFLCSDFNSEGREARSSPEVKQLLPPLPSPTLPKVIEGEGSRLPFISDFVVCVHPPQGGHGVPK
jgi:hypothetical protein